MEFKLINESCDFGHGRMIGYVFRDEGKPLLRDVIQLLDNVTPEDLSDKLLRLRISLETSRAMIANPLFVAAKDYDERLGVLAQMCGEGQTDSAGE